MVREEQPTTEIVAGLLRDAEKSRLWGNVQLDFQDGKLVLIRQTTTTKIGGENNHAPGRYK